MSRKRLWDLLYTSWEVIAHNSTNSLELLKSKVNKQTASPLQPEPIRQQQSQHNQLEKLKNFWQGALEVISRRNRLAVDGGIERLKKAAKQVKSEESPEPQRFLTQVDATLEDHNVSGHQHQHNNQNDEVTKNVVEGDEQMSKVYEEGTEKPNEVESLERSLEPPPTINHQYSFQDKYKPSEKLSQFILNGINSLVSRQRQANMAASKLVASPPSDLVPVNEHPQEAEESLPRGQDLRLTANFPTSMEEVEPLADSTTSPNVIHDIRPVTHIRSNSLPVVEQQPPYEFPQADQQEQNQFISYVEQERMSKLNYDVQQLKKQHLPTNYDASDEQSVDPNKPPSYLNPRYKHKTEISNESTSRIFQPRIYVIEAPEKNVSSTVDVREKRHPDTDPKKKTRKRTERHAVSKSLVRTPFKISNKSNSRDSFEYDIANYTEKILKLKEARRKKLQLQQKLELINKQIIDIKNPEVALEEIRQSRSPRNNIKQMIYISDDKEAKNRALALVRKLRNQRQKRQKLVSNIFNRVDKEVMESITELNRVRQQQDRQAKQRRKLEVLERMREQQRRKLDEYRLLEDHGSFLQALKRHEQKIKPVQSRRSMAWIREDDTPELAAKKQMLEKLRNLSYVEKRSIIEQYNRQLLRK